MATYFVRKFFDGNKVIGKHKFGDLEMVGYLPLSQWIMWGGVLGSCLN